MFIKPYDDDVFVFKHLLEYIQSEIVFTISMCVIYHYT